MVKRMTILTPKLAVLVCGNKICNLRVLHEMNKTVAKTGEPSDCKNGDVRLRGGTSISNGLVETCQDKQWIAVCNIDPKKAQYVCKQLNFDPQGICCTMLDIC